MAIPIFQQLLATTQSSERVLSCQLLQTHFESQDGGARLGQQDFTKPATSAGGVEVGHTLRAIELLVSSSVVLV